MVFNLKGVKRMKKYLGVIACTLLMLPVIINADMGSPMIEQYDAEVINKDGAYIYDYESGKGYYKTDKKIDYKQKVTVVSEEDYDETNIYCTITGYQLIRCKDISAFSKDYKYDTTTFAQAIDSIVLKDVEIKKGPALGFDSTGVKISSGNVIKVRAIDESTQWYYVEYNGTSGFISSANGAFTLGRAESAIISGKEVDIYDFNNNKIGTIPTNTILKKGVYNLDPWFKKDYVNYNGIKGFVDNRDFANNSCATVETTIVLKIYDSTDANKEIGSLKSGTSFETQFITTGLLGEAQGSWIHYKKDNVEGWIFIDYEDNGVKLNYTQTNSIELEDNNIQEDKPLVENNQNNTIVDPTKPLTKNTLIMIIMGAIITFLTIFIIVLLVNKKGENK
jgi:hypothetical protein